MGERFSVPVRDVRGTKSKKGIVSFIDIDVDMGDGARGTGGGYGL